MTNRLRRLLCHACLLGGLLSLTGHAAAEPQNGWWWNPNESGRGFFIEMTGGVMYLAGYFYEEDGRATWLSSGGPVTDLYLYKGTLQSFSNGQSVFGSYRLPDTIVDVGPVTVSFTDDSHGTITWPGGTIPIERDIFGDISNFDPTAFQPKTGWWWNPAESGSGYSVEIQGESAFVVAFMYTDSGEPVWYFTAGPMATPTHFENDWLELSGGQTLSGPYRPPAPTNLGRVAIDFAAADDATITFTEGEIAAAAKESTEAAAGRRSRSTRARPQLTGPTWQDSDFPAKFICSAFQRFVSVSDAGTEGGKFKTDKAYTYHLEFVRNDQFQLGKYWLDQDQSWLSYFIDTSDSSNGCETHGERISIKPLLGSLDIEADGLYYSGIVYDTIGSSVTIHDSCGGPDRAEGIPIDFELGSKFSQVQNTDPPWMKTRDWRTLPNGTDYYWSWDCEGERAEE